MWFLYLMSWISTIVQICFITLAIAAGLYYLAELVEEYTVYTGKIIKFMVLSTMAVYVGLFLFEDLPPLLIAFGIFGEITHLLILRTFPFFALTSVPFILGTCLIVVNHYLAFSHFSQYYYPFSEVIAYFTICLWMVPFAFLVSLSANENVLPTLSETRPILSGDSDIVTNYFSRKGKKYGLLTFFNYAKESVLPQRVKKVF